jgi:cytochrome c oxidase assembly protein Cox11
MEERRRIIAGRNRALGLTCCLCGAVLCHHHREDEDLMATAAALAKASRGKMRTGLAALAFAAGMLMLGYASVPLYRMFCQATGYGGTPRRASEAEAGATQKLAGKTISIRFDANIDPGMKWTFRPEKTTQTVTIGKGPWPSSRRRT